MNLPQLETKRAQKQNLTLKSRTGGGNKAYEYFLNCPDHGEFNVLENEFFNQAVICPECRALKPKAVHDGGLKEVDIRYYKKASQIMGISGEKSLSDWAYFEY